MSTLYSSDFETGSGLPAGWTASVGTWAIGTTLPIGGTKSFESTTKTAGDVALRTGEAAQGDCVWTIHQKVVDAASNAGRLYGLIIRMSSGYTNGYLWLPEGGTGGSIDWGWWKRTDSSWSRVNGFSTNIGAVNGSVIHVEAKSVGSTHELRVWKDGEARPSAASATRTDASFTSGYPGLYYTAGGGSTHTAVDDLLYEDVASAATAVTMTGPSSGGVGVASTNFTVGANGTITGTVVVTPSDSDGGGTFSPTSVSISSGSPTGTFTYTPGSTGAKTISVTNNGSLANPGNITYTASAAPNNIAVTNSALFFSPYNWYSEGAGALAANNIKGSSTYAQSNNPGAYLKFKVTLATTGDVVMNFNNSHLTGIAAGDYPVISVFRDSNAPTTTQLSGTTAQAITLASGLVAGTYQFVVLFKSCNVSGGDRWNTPALSVKTTGLTIPGDASVSAPVLRSRNLVIYGDSIAEGVHNIGSTTVPADQDAGYTWAHFVAAALDAEVGVIGFGGQGYAASGVGNVPAFGTALSSYSSGRSRLVSTQLSPVPDLAIVAHGENDTAGVSLAALTTLRSATSAPIVVSVPFTGKIRSDLAGATLPSNTRLVDVNVSGGDGSHLLYYTGYQSPLHPSVQGSAYIAGRLAKLIERGRIKTTRTVQVTLVNASNTAQTGLSNLKWAWWDQVTPDKMGTPTDNGSVETTDGSGVLSISVRSALSVGQIGWLIVTDSDGNPATVHKAFSGPVTVA